MFHSNERIKYLDIAKGIGIILVIMGHSGFLSDTLNFFVNSFHMPLFFVISGALMYFKKEENKPFGEFMGAKVDALLTPYFWFSFFILLFYMIQGFVQKTFFSEFVPGFSARLISIFTFDGDSVMWFLPALLLGEIITYLVYRYVRRAYCFPVSIALGAIAYLLSLLLPSLETKPESNWTFAFLLLARVLLRGFISSFFVAAGYFFFETVEKLLKPMNRIAYAVIGMAMLLGTLFLSRYVPHNDYHRLMLGNGYMYMICALLGSFGVILFSMGIEHFRLLEFFGRNSLVIMCTHLDFCLLYLGIQFAWVINEFVTHAKSYIFMFVIVTTVLALESLIIMFFNYFCPFMLGKKR